jgi:alkanesulfonate monooxygenase SsuD/methylene tetrahydromethanopterin reductase-like flavin-dependent oxidoreductase (luciferase family)
MQFGAYTFVETRRDPTTGEPVDVDKAFANVIEQIELADRVGLDVFGLGEHHRPDYAVSARRWRWPRPPRAPSASA